MTLEELDELEIEFKELGSLVRHENLVQCGWLALIEHGSQSQDSIKRAALLKNKISESRKYIEFLKSIDEKIMSIKQSIKDGKVFKKEAKELWSKLEIFEQYKKNRDDAQL